MVVSKWLVLFLYGRISLNTSVETKFSIMNRKSNPLDFVVLLI